MADEAPKVILETGIDFSGLEADASKWKLKIGKLYEESAKLGKSEKQRFKDSLQPLDQLILKQQRLQSLLEKSAGTTQFNKLKGALSDVNKELANVTASTQKTVTTTKGLFSNLTGHITKEMKLAGAAIAGAFALNELKSFAKESVMAFADQEKQLVLLNNQVVKIGGEGADAFEKLKNQAEELQKQGFISDDEVEKVQIFLSQFGLGADQIQEAIPKILDFAAATGQSLDEAANSVVQGTNGMGRALKKYGLDVEDSGDKTTNLNNILTQLGSKFKGSALEVSETTLGGFKKLSLAFGEFQETVGGLLAPVASFVANGLSKLTNGITELISPSKSAVDAFTQQRDKVVELTTKMPNLLTEYDKLSSQTSLNKDEQQKLNDTIDKIIELVPQAGEKFDDYGKAISINKQVIQDYIQSQKDLQNFLAIDAIAEANNKLKELKQTQKELQEGASKFSGVTISLQSLETGVTESRRLLNLAKSDIAAYKKELRIPDFENLSQQKAILQQEKALNAAETALAERKQKIAGLNSLIKGGEDQILNLKGEQTEEQKKLNTQLQEQVGILVLAQQKLTALQDAQKSAQTEDEVKSIQVKIEAQQKYIDSLTKVKDAQDVLVKGSMAFYQKAVSDITEKLGKVNLRSDTAKKLAGELTIAQDQLNHATDIYKDLLGEIAAVQPEEIYHPEFLQAALDKVNIAADQQVIALQERLKQGEISYEEYQFQLDLLNTAHENARLQTQIDFQKQYVEELKLANKPILEEQAKLVELERQLGEKKITDAHDLAEKVKEIFKGVAQAEKDASDEGAKEWQKNLLSIADTAETVVNQLVQGIQAITDALIQQQDLQIHRQERRVEEAMKIAEKGNAELLQREQERLDESHRKQAAYVRTQQALNIVLAASNMVVAISKAVAEGGGIGSIVTVAAAIASFAGGLLAARTAIQSSQEGFFVGGYTGDGNPKERSNQLGSKPYTYHKGEFVFDHEDTAAYREAFEAIHNGDIDLNKTLQKAKAFDELNYGLNHEAIGRMVVVNAGGNGVEMRATNEKLDRLIEAVGSQERFLVTLRGQDIYMLTQKFEGASSLKKKLAK